MNILSSITSAANGAYNALPSFQAISASLTQVANSTLAYTPASVKAFGAVIVTPQGATTAILTIATIAILYLLAKEVSKLTNLPEQRQSPAQPYYFEDRADYSKEGIAGLYAKYCINHGLNWDQTTVDGIIDGTAEIQEAWFDIKS